MFLWLCADCEVDADTLERDAHEVGDARGGGAGLPSASAAAVAAAAAAEAFKAEAGEEVDGVGVAERECVWEPMVRHYFHTNLKVRVGERGGGGVRKAVTFWFCESRCEGKRTGNRPRALVLERARKRE